MKLTATEIPELKKREKNLYKQKYGFSKLERNLKKGLKEVKSCYKSRNNINLTSRFVVEGIEKFWLKKKQNQKVDKLLHSWFFE